jgi:hypothetical protein
MSAVTHHGDPRQRGSEGERGGGGHGDGQRTHPPDPPPEDLRVVEVPPSPKCSFPSPTDLPEALAAAAVVDGPQPPVVVYDVRLHARDDVGVVGRGATPPLRHAVNDEREDVLGVSGSGHKGYSIGNGLLVATVLGRVAGEAAAQESADENG